MSKSSVGGARAVSGVGHEIRILAWLAVYMLCGRRLPGWAGGRILDAVGGQTELAVDDVGAIFSDGGFLLIQAKKGLKLESGLQSALGESLIQLILLKQEGIPIPSSFSGDTRPIDRVRDLVLIASDSSASASIRKDARRVTERLRNLPDRIPLVHSAAGDKRCERALEVLVGHLRRIHASYNGVEPDDQDIREMLSILAVRTIELSDGEAHYESAITILRSVLNDPREAQTAWAWLLSRMQGLAETRAWISRDRLCSEFSFQFNAKLSSFERLDEKGEEIASTQPFKSDRGSTNNDTDYVSVVISPIPGVRTAPGDFVGRIAERDKLLNALNPATKTPSGSAFPIVSIVTGMGGVGKSALINHVGSHAVRNGWFSGGAFLVSFSEEGEDSARNWSPVLEPILRSLGIPGDQIPQSRTSQISTLHNLLHNVALRGDRLLLVFDGVSESSQILELIPKDEQHRVLIATRNTLSIGPATTVSLKNLDPDDAIKLLDNVLVGRDPTDNRIRSNRLKSAQLARMCDHLPLALLISASLLADDTSLTVDALNQDLAEELNEVGVDALTYGNQAVARSFEISWRHLMDRHPGSADLLQRIACVPGVDISAEAVAAISCNTTARIRPMLRILQQAHFLESSDRRWRMHDLVRKYVSHQVALSYDPADVVELLQNYYLESASKCDRSLHLASAGSIDGEAHVQALEWFDAERVNLVAMVQWVASAGNYMSAAMLSFALVRYFSLRRYLADWLETAECAVSASKENPPVYAKALENLGRVLQELRNFDRAALVHREAVHIWTLMGERLEAAGSLNSLGLAYRQLERFSEAADSHRKASAIGEELENQDLQANALNNLGLDLRYLGELDQAINAHKDALKLHNRIGDKSGAAMAWNNIGLVYQCKGLTKEAILAHESAARIFEEHADIFGKGTALLNLGQALCDTDRLGEAVKRSQEAVEVFDALGADYHKAAALSVRATALYGLGDDQKAIEDHRAAHAIFDQTESRAEAAKSLTQLAKSLGRSGRLLDAVEALFEASVIYGRIDRMAEQAATLDEAGAIHSYQGDFAHAIEVYRKALRICRAANLAEAESEVLMHLAHAYLGIGNRKRAIMSMRMAAGVAANVGDRMLEGSALNDLAAFLHDVGQHDDAWRTCLDALAAFREVGEPSYEAFALMNQGEIAETRGDRQKAIGCWKSALAIFERLKYLEGVDEVRRLLGDDL
ncbi:tetratricopeptide repeat protein [Amycolatopsis sp. NPDC004378]